MSEPSSCCAPSVQLCCCEPAAKESCCGSSNAASAGETASCRCAAGAGAGTAAAVAGEGDEPEVPASRTADEGGEGLSELPVAVIGAGPVGPAAAARTAIATT